MSNSTCQDSCLDKFDNLLLKKQTWREEISRPVGAYRLTAQHNVRQPHPARRCIPSDTQMPQPAVGAYRPTAPPGLSVHTARLPRCLDGAYRPTAPFPNQFTARRIPLDCVAGRARWCILPDSPHRCTPPDCPPPARRCIPPDGPCQPPFGAWRVGYIALSPACFTPYRLPAAVIPYPLNSTSSYYRPARALSSRPCTPLRSQDV